MKPILKYFRKSLVSAGGLISMMSILIRQLCVEGGCCDVDYA